MDRELAALARRSVEELPEPLDEERDEPDEGARSGPLTRQDPLCEA